MTLRVLIADDHELLRDGLKPFLEELDDIVEFLEAGNLDEAVRGAEQGPPPHLVLLDLKMPGMDGAKGIERMSRAAPNAKIVILSGQFGQRDILDAINKGASGYIPKTMAGRSMISALRLVLTGEVYLPAALLAHDADDAATMKQTYESDNPLSRLTRREMEILGLLIEGNTNKEIARATDVQEITIKVHLRNVYKKLAATNRADAVRVALQNGWQS